MMIYRFDELLATAADDGASVPAGVPTSRADTDEIHEHAPSGEHAILFSVGRYDELWEHGGDSPWRIMLPSHYFHACVAGSGDPEGVHSVTKIRECPHQFSFGPARGDRLVVRASVGEFAPTDEVIEELVGLYRALNAYHIACGGSGLELDEWQVLVPAAEPAEVG